MADYIMQQQPAYQPNPPVQPGGLDPNAFDFSAEIKKSLADAEKSQARARKMNMIGNILQGAGMLAGLVNNVYQTSKGRVPIDIANPVVGMGALVGNVGQTYQNQANKTIAQGMMNDKALPPHIAKWLQVQAVTDPKGAMDAAYKFMAPDMSKEMGEFVTLHGRPPSSEKEFTEFLNKRGYRPNVVVGASGGMFGMGAPKVAAPSGSGDTASDYHP